jgi:hypothetical protein
MSSDKLEKAVVYLTIVILLATCALLIWHLLWR